MKWSASADQAMKKVPFFVRKKVRQRVEAHAGQKGKQCVELSDVTELKEKFLSKGGMEKDIKGYEVSSCFGDAGCPNTANSCKALADDIEKILKEADLISFLKQNITGDLKFHHEFRVALAECPNACSRPQIVDIGIIGAAVPGLSGKPCSLCGLCVDVCDEQAIVLDDDKNGPVIDFDACLACQKCIRACPTGTIVEEKTGFRVMLGGRLGRHPRLAMEIKGIHSHDEVLMVVKNCLAFYKNHSKNGRRFSHLLSSVDQITAE